MNETVTRADVVEDLTRQIEAAGGRRIWTEQHGISLPYLSMVLNGKREPGPFILGILGYRKVTGVAYERVEQ